MEDDHHIREMLNNSLTRIGYTVHTAGNGREGFDLAHQHAGKIDLLLTDVIMPLMNGHDPALALQDDSGPENHLHVRLHQRHYKQAWPA
ncbi:MAG: response regulator [Proteobacteria bacterium]|nr:response regulator [Pseudomonadota bacterium]MBU1738711.1 response regulator [Pseudomonadota bacterium]